VIGESKEKDEKKGAATGEAGSKVPDDTDIVGEKSSPQPNGHPG
jgi:hypothetical protein